LSDETTNRRGTGPIRVFGVVSPRKGIIATVAETGDSMQSRGWRGRSAGGKEVWTKPGGKTALIESTKGASGAAKTTQQRRRNWNHQQGGRRLWAIGGSNREMALQVLSQGTEKIARGQKSAFHWVKRTPEGCGSIGWTDGKTKAYLP